MSTKGNRSAGKPFPAWMKAVSVLVFMISAVPVIMTIMGNLATSEWDRYAASLRADGEPLTMAEIEAKRPAIMPDRNGALVLSDNLEALTSLTAGGVDADVLIFGARWGADGQAYDFFSGIPRKSIEASRAFRQDHRALVEDLARLRDRRHGRFELKHQPNPLDTLLPHTAPARAASRLLRLDSNLKVIDGDLDGAMEDATLLFNLAGTLHTEPGLISRLVQMSIEAVGVRTIEEILRAAELSEPQLFRLQGVVEGCLADQSIRWALWGERAINVEALEQVLLGNLGVNAITGGGSAGLSWLPTWLVRQNQHQAAKLCGSLIEDADDPDALIATAQGLELTVDQLPLKYTLVKVMMPSLTRAAILHVRIIAESRCARAALAAERFRLREGRFPGSMDELVPEYLDGVPVDPFDGQSLRLTRVEQGIVIYSVGEDRQDDGGSVARSRSGKANVDVGFRLFAPEHRGLLVLDDEPSD